MHRDRPIDMNIDFIDASIRYLVLVILYYIVRPCSKVQERVTYDREHVRRRLLLGRVGRET